MINWKTLEEIVDSPQASDKTQKRPWIPPEVREGIKARDGACRVCGSVKELQIHHVQPFGPSEPANLILLCRYCHQTTHLLLRCLGKHRFVNLLSIGEDD